MKPQLTGPARVYLDGEFLGIADQVKVAERSTEIHGIGPGHATVNGQRVPGVWQYNARGFVEFVPDEPLRITAPLTASPDCIIGRRSMTPAEIRATILKAYALIQRHTVPDATPGDEDFRNDLPRPDQVITAPTTPAD